jgi:uncharacterized protein DUF4440
MNITRRDLAAAGAFALGAAALLSSGTAEAADEAAVTDAVEAMRKAVVDKNKAELDKLTAEQLSYGHSGAVVQNKAEFIDGVMGRKSTIKSLSYPELKVTMAGNNAISRHRLVQESEQDGKASNVDIGILEVWTKQDAGWKLLARQGFKLPVA